MLQGRLYTIKWKSDHRGEPVAILYRMDLDNELSTDEKLEYLENNMFHDSMNSESGAGWYSVISAEKKRKADRSDIFNGQMKNRFK